MKYPNYSFPDLKYGKHSYAAGCIDCDGSIYIQRHFAKQKRGNHYVYRLRVELSNTCKSLLDYFSLTYGGTIRYSKKTKAGKDYWHWGFGGNSAYYFIVKIEPFLKVKEKQAKLAVYFQEQKMRHFKKKRTLETESWEENQYKAMCKLNI